MSEEKIKKLDEGIDLMEVFLKIRKRKRTVFSFMAMGLVLSILVVLVTPKQFKTQVTLLAESGSKNSSGGLLGQLGGLAGGINLGGLTGLNLGGSSGSDALTPDLYPDIVKSTPLFIRGIESEGYGIERE